MSVALSDLHLLGLIRIVRAHKDVVSERRLQVEMQLTTHNDSQLNVLLLELDNELAFVENLLAALWRMQGNRAPPP